MPTVTIPQYTLFSFDIFGRYGCNNLEEAVNSINRPNPSYLPDVRLIRFSCKRAITSFWR